MTVSWAVFIHPPPGKPTKTGPESQKDVVSLPLDSSISGEIDSSDEYFTAHCNSPLKESHRGQKSAKFARGTKQNGFSSDTFSGHTRSSEGVNIKCLIILVTPTDSCSILNLISVPHSS